MKTSKINQELINDIIYIIRKDKSRTDSDKIILIDAIISIYQNEIENK